MVLEEASQAEVWGIWRCSVGLVGKVLNPTEDKVPGTDPYSIDWQGQDDRTPELVVDKQS